jgi:hypothetical protein
MAARDGAAFDSIACELGAALPDAIIAWTPEPPRGPKFMVLGYQRFATVRVPGKAPREVGKMLPSKGRELGVELGHIEKAPKGSNRPELVTYLIN